VCVSCVLTIHMKAFHALGSGDCHDGLHLEVHAHMLPVQCELVSAEAAIVVWPRLHHPAMTHGGWHGSAVLPLERNVSEGQLCIISQNVF
jgi:hypothetical protein